MIAPRYIVPVVPLLAAGAAAAAMRLALAIPVAARIPSVAAGLVCVASVIPPAAAMVAAPARDTRIEALEWCSKFVAPSALVAVESGGPPLLAERRAERIERDALFRTATPAAQERYRARRRFNQVNWPLFVHGDLPANLAGPGEAPRWVQVFPEAVDLGAAFYDLRLLGLADYVITSSVVRSRYEADTARFATQVSAYRSLDRDAERVAWFAPGRGLAGPDIRVYRVSDPTRARWMGDRPALEMGWWLTSVPPGAAIRGEVPAGAPPLPDGRPGWALRLGEFHDLHVAPTLFALAAGARRAGREAGAQSIERIQTAWHGEPMPERSP